MSSIWDILGIVPTREPGEIRRAYARRLKVTNPEDDPEGFKALREAYEAALNGPQFVHVAAPNQPPVTAKPTPPPPESSLDSSPDPRIHHARLQADLERLLRQPAPIEAEVLAAYEAVLTSPAMAILDVETSTENWLAGILPQHIPQSDSLIPLAIKRFNWRDNSLLRRLPGAIPWLFRREVDLDFVRSIRQWGAPHFKAYHILSRPFTPITLLSRLSSPQLPDQVASLLNEIRTKYPTAIANLNGDTVEHWGAWFAAGPHLMGKRLLTVLLAPFSLLLFLLGWFLMPSPGNVFSLVFVIPPIVAGLFLLDRPRAWWAQRRDTAPLWQTYGWLPLLMAALAVAAIPGLPLSPLPVLFLGGAAVAWASIVAESDTRTSDLSNLILRELAVAGWAIAVTLPLSRAQAFQFATAAMAAIMAGVIGSTTLHARYRTLPKWARQAAVVLTLLASLCALALLIHATEQNGWRLTAISAVLAVTTLYRPLTSQSPALGIRTRLAILVAMIIWTVPDAHVVLTLIGGATWGAVNLTRAVAELKDISRRTAGKRMGLA